MNKWDNMRLLHYSAAPFTKVKSHEQVGRKQWGEESGSQMKPCGTWVSVEGEYDWKSWCESERFSLDQLRYETQVVLKEDANVLVLSTPEELDEFTQKYLNEKSVLRKDRGPDYNQVRHDCYAIDWGRVAKDYQGIIIAPYIWDRRLSLMWYYGWDCASGCIWDAEAIKELVQPQKESLEKKIRYVWVSAKSWWERSRLKRLLWRMQIRKFLKGSPEGDMLKKMDKELRKKKITELGESALAVALNKYIKKAQK